MASSDRRYELVFKKSVAKDLRAPLKQDVRRILDRIDELAAEPRPAGCEKLTRSSRYRIRQGIYRIVYEIQDRRLLVLIVTLAHRREAYKKH